MLSYEELLAQYNLLKRENESLKRQIDSFQKQFGRHSEEAEKLYDIASEDVVSMRSTPEEKIKLFRSLFCGREDVFARRWYSATIGKSGYQPVCSNEWADGLCDKKKHKCSSCPNRKLTPLSDKYIFSHLAGKDLNGRDVIGIYPMLPDETCSFICADFDDENYKDDVSAFSMICRMYNIPLSIERSRSGNGAHAWIFFDEPVSAVTSRRLGTAILTQAMDRYSELSFKSYDRLFPNQDTMPLGGFGNLIALPLQGQARKNGNSVFVNDDFAPYPDQWSFLSSIIKLSKESAEALASKLSKHNELGTLVSDSDESPWKTPAKETLTPADFPLLLNITQANMLYIKSSQLSSSAKNQIKRLAAFKNPDFYRAQAMRLPTYNKPRIICTADITGDYIGIPRGCKEALCAMLEAHCVPYQIDDKTNEGTEIKVDFNGCPRDEQQPAADALLNTSTGVLSATTAFGKTVIAAYLISKRKTNTLILVHTAALMQQWKKSLEQFLTFDIEPPQISCSRVRKKAWFAIGVLGSGKNELHGIVDIALMQSLVSDSEVKALVRNYGMIIVDECHHVSAVSFEKILSFANAKFVYGLTATPTRQDGHHPIIFMQCGAIRYRVDAKAQAEKRSFEHYLIPRFTAFRSFSDSRHITKLYSELAENEQRNSLIINDIISALDGGRCPLVLTERREHVALLAERLTGKCKNIISLVGTISAKERRETMERLEAVPADEQLVIIATGKYVGEGFDFPRLDTLFLALPISWKGKVAQYAGRLHRNYAGKTEVQIYDYADIHVSVLEQMYQKRIKSYASIGYKIKISAANIAVPDLIYDGKSFYHIFCEDIKNTQHELVIVSPFMRKSRLAQIVPLLSALVSNGKSVTVITRPAENFKEAERKKVAANAEYLKQSGVTLRFKADFHQKFTIIDKKVVWYGSVNFLSFGAYEESIMRFESSDIAGQLIDTVV